MLPGEPGLAIRGLVAMTEDDAAWSRQRGDLPADTALSLPLPAEELSSSVLFGAFPGDPGLHAQRVPMPPPPRHQRGQDQLTAYRVRDRLWPLSRKGLVDRHLQGVVRPDRVGCHRRGECRTP